MQLYTKILIGMLVGIVLGLGLGPDSRLLPKTAAVLPASIAVHQTPGSAQRVKQAQGLRRGAGRHPALAAGAVDAPTARRGAAGCGRR